MANDVTQEDDYRTKVFAMFPTLEVLDGTNKDGEEVDSEDFGENDFDFEGEEEDMIGDEQWNKMTEDERQKFLLGNKADFEEGEYGEEEMSEEGYGSEEGDAAAKQGHPEKRAKKE